MRERERCKTLKKAGQVERPLGSRSSQRKEIYLQVEIFSHRCEKFLFEMILWLIFYYLWCFFLILKNRPAVSCITDPIRRKKKGMMTMIFYGVRDYFSLLELFFLMQQRIFDTPRFFVPFPPKGFIFRFFCFAGIFWLHKKRVSHITVVFYA